MGCWGVEPWENDGAADWFADLMDETGLPQFVENALHGDLIEEHEQIRAAAAALISFGRIYVWPIDQLERHLNLALNRLEEMLKNKEWRKLHEPAPDIVLAVKQEVATLKERIRSSNLKFLRKIKKEPEAADVEELAGDDDLLSELSQPRVSCPVCFWKPDPEIDQWYCEQCHTSWNTFETGGICPSCTYHYHLTSCLACDTWSPHNQWYLPEAVEFQDPPHICGQSRACFSNVSGLSSKEQKALLRELRKLIKWNDYAEAKSLWESFEKSVSIAELVRIAEELIVRKATWKEYYLAYVLAPTYPTTSSALEYLDFARLRANTDSELTSDDFYNALGGALLHPRVFWAVNKENDLGILIAYTFKSATKGRWWFLFKGRKKGSFYIEYTDESPLQSKPIKSVKRLTLKEAKRERTIETFDWAKKVLERD